MLKTHGKRQPALMREEPPELVDGTHLVPQEVMHLSSIGANIGILLIFFNVVAIATFVLNGWKEWGANGWLVLHWYIVPLTPLILLVVLLPVELLREYELGTVSPRREFVERHSILVHFGFYVLCVGILMEAVAISYLIYAHAAGSIILAGHVAFLALAYGISCMNLALMGAMWYQLHRLHEYVDTCVAKGHVARTL